MALQIHQDRVASDLLAMIDGLTAAPSNGAARLRFPALGPTGVPIFDGSSRSPATPVPTPNSGIIRIMWPWTTDEDPPDRVRIPREATWAERAVTAGAPFRLQTCAPGEVGPNHPVPPMQ